MLLHENENADGNQRKRKEATILLKKELWNNLHPLF
jgi:hypothetical protein